MSIPASRTMAPAFFLALGVLVTLLGACQAFPMSGVPQGFRGEITPEELESAGPRGVLDDLALANYVDYLGEDRGEQGRRDEGALDNYLGGMETRQYMSHYPFAVPYSDWRSYGSVMGLRPHSTVKRGRLDTLLAKLQRIAGSRDGGERINIMRFGPGRR